MFYWGLLLLSGVLAHFEEQIIDNYIIGRDHDILISVKPTAMSSDHLDLSNQNFVRIEDGAFRNVKLTNLSLAHNFLNNYLPEFAFWQLRNLEYLSLSGNGFLNQQFVFGGLENLKKLDISNNNLTELEDGFFYGLTRATEIERTGNDFGKISSNHYRNPYTGFLSLCISDGIVKSLKVLKKINNSLMTARCIIKIRPMLESWVQFIAEGIRGVQKGWYRLHRLKVTTLDLRHNNIKEITRDLLNDLPKGLTKVNLAGNKIGYVKAGVIDNDNLLLLNLTNNPINRVEDGAYDNAKNCKVLV